MRSYLFPPCLAVLVTVASSIASGQPVASEPAEKSVAVYPIVLSTSRSVPDDLPERLAEVVGTLLERAGMDTVEIADASFAVDQAEDLDDLAKRFAEHVRANPPETECAAFGQMLADANQFNEIRTVVVDGKGKVIFSDSAVGKKLSEAKSPPRDPMSACVFLADRLGQVWDLKDPLQKNAPDGKMAERMRERSGVPPQAELDAMRARQQALATKTGRGSLAVYPVHVWKGWDPAQAKKLAAAVEAKKLFTTNVITEHPEWDVQGDPNQQKVLWDTARSFRNYLWAQPVAADYALLVDCGLAPSQNDERIAHHVHLVLCTGDGEWVLVDYQNSHHADFQRLSPKSVEQCTRLALTRLQKRLAAEP